MEDNAQKLKVVRSFRKYFIFNTNRKNEMEIIDQLIDVNSLTGPQVTYIRTRFIDALFALDQLAIRNKYLFYLLRMFILIIGALLPVITNIDSLLPELDNKFLKLGITLVSIVPVVSYSILQIFKNDKMWIHHRLKFELIKCDLYRFLNLSGNYRDFSSQSDAFNVFVSRVESMFEKEIKDYFKTIDIVDKSNDTVPK